MGMMNVGGNRFNQVDMTTTGSKPLGNETDVKLKKNTLEKALKLDSDGNVVSYDNIGDEVYKWNDETGEYEPTGQHYIMYYDPETGKTTFIIK